MGKAAAEIADLIRTLRMQSGCDVSQWAHALGVSLASAYRWERADQNWVLPRRATLQRMLRLGAASQMQAIGLWLAAGQLGEGGIDASA